VVAWLVRGGARSVRRRGGRAAGVPVRGGRVWLSRRCLSCVLAGRVCRVVAGLGGRGRLVSGAGSLVGGCVRSGQDEPQAPRRGRRGAGGPAALLVLDHTVNPGALHPAALLLAVAALALVSTASRPRYVVVTRVSGNKERGALNNRAAELGGPPGAKQSAPGRAQGATITDTA
jgi:hypothetical protein